MPPTESRVKINGFAALDIAADRCSQTIKRSVAAPSPDYRRTTSFSQRRICEKYLTVPFYIMFHVKQLLFILEKPPRLGGFDFIVVS